MPRLLHGVVEFYKSRLDAQGIRVEARFCPGEDLAVDPGSLRQAFSNLLLNAAYAMPHGGIMHARVAKAHEWSGLNRHGLRVTFADNGCGISADDLPKVTDAFFTTKGSAGTGLGLALVKDTVRNATGLSACEAALNLDEAVPFLRSSCPLSRGYSAHYLECASASAALRSWVRSCCVSSCDSSPPSIRPHSPSAFLQFVVVAS